MINYKVSETVFCEKCGAVLPTNNLNLKSGQVTGIRCSNGHHNVVNQLPYKSWNLGMGSLIISKDEDGDENYKLDFGYSFVGVNKTFLKVTLKRKAEIFAEDKITRNVDLSHYTIFSDLEDYAKGLLAEFEGLNEATFALILNGDKAYLGENHVKIAETYGKEIFAGKLHLRGTFNPETLEIIKIFR